MRFDFRYAPNFTQRFNGNAVPAAMIWIGYNLGGNRCAGRLGSLDRGQHFLGVAFHLHLGEDFLDLPVLAD